MRLDEFYHVHVGGAARAIAASTLPMNPPWPLEPRRAGPCRSADGSSARAPDITLEHRADGSFARLVDRKPLYRKGFIPRFQNFAAETFRGPLFQPGRSS